MSRHHRIPGIRLLGTVVLGLSLLAGTAPAQASEVVKLARLLITGKRAPSKPPTSPQPNPADRGGSTDAPGPQSRLTDNETPASSHAQAHALAERRASVDATMSMVD